MTLRRLTREDYDAVEEMTRELDRIHAQARPDCFVLREEVYPREPYEAALEDPDCLLLGAVEDGKLLGFVRATLWHESFMVKTLKTVCLDDIFVLPACRGKGVGSKLFAETERWAREQGAVRLDLHVWEFNREAQALYRSAGMTPQRHVLEKML